VFGAERRSLFWRALAFWLLSFSFNKLTASARAAL